MPGATLSLIVIGFAIEPNARELVDSARPCRRPRDIRPGNPRSCDGRPAEDDEIEPGLLRYRSSRCGDQISAPGGKGWSIPPPSRTPRAGRLRPHDDGSRTIDRGSDVPAWFLDTDYNELSFHVSQAFFPRTERVGQPQAGSSARSSRTPSGTTWREPRAPRSSAGEHRKIAVKVIDDRGNELMVVRPLDWLRPMADASSFEVEEPILSSPLRGTGRALADRRGQGSRDAVPGRRPAGYFYRDPGTPACWRRVHPGRLGRARTLSTSSGNA